jgi:predicted ATPase
VKPALARRAWPKNFWTAHCYAAGGRFTLAPVQEWLRAPIFQKNRQAVDAVWRSEASRLLPELLTEQKGVAMPPTLAENWQRQRLFEALARLTLHDQPPLLLLLDDIQWCDEDTLAWLHYLLRFDPTARLLIIATARQEELQQEQRLLAFLSQLRQTELLHEERLERLSSADTAALVANLTGHADAQNSATAIYAETEGNPLFIVETVRARLGQEEKSGRAAPTSRSPTAPVAPGAMALPPKVHAVIEARLTQLSPEAHDLARVAAVIGRAFDAAVLGKASESTEDELVQGLDELWQHGIIREQGFNRLGVEAYDFSHDKLREVAYHSLSSIRRRLLHRRVAEALEFYHADQTDDVNHQLARHYEWGGVALKAIGYYQRAAAVAHRLAAVHEAIDFLTHAQGLLPLLPPGDEQTRLALALQIDLGPLLLATKGYAAPEVERAFREAWQLCQQVGDAQQRFQVLWGLGKFYQVKPDLVKGTAVARDLLALAQVEENPELLMEAYSIAGTHFFHNVALRDAKQYLDESVALYDPERHAHHALLYGQDPAIVGLTYGAWTRWCLGYPAQALRQAQAALTLAEQLTHPYSRAVAMTYMTVQYQFLGDVEGCRRQAAATMELTHTYGFTLWLASATFLHGWAVAAQGDFERGMAQMQEGIDLYRATGAELGSAYFAGLLAERLGLVGQREIGIAVMNEAFDLLERTQDRWCEAELYRLKGELLAQLNDPALWTLLGQTPDDCFQQALTVARRQGARWWELRALVSLCHHWRHDDRAAEAYRQLAACYQRFDEGRDLPLLQTARSMVGDRMTG